MANRVRYAGISKTVWSLVKNFGIRSYPVDLDGLARSLDRTGTNVKFQNYSAYAEFKNEPIDRVEEELGSQDGVTAYIPEASLYIIFINDRHQSKGRANWTKAHEIGHVALGHYSAMEPVLLARRGIDDKKYGALEREADWFAKLLLCHPLVLSGCGVRTAGEIAKICGISRDAAENRLGEVLRPLRAYNRHDRMISDHFEGFVKSFASKVCVRCRNGFTMAGSGFCPVCGGGELERMVGEFVIYSRVRIDGNHKAVRCPRCDNEEVRGEGDYCQICGVNLVNRCFAARDDFGHPDAGVCGELAEGDARYCCRCGNMTTFGHHGLLKGWAEEMREKCGGTPLDEMPDDDVPF